ncbi:MAG: hypothetical protein CVT67_09405 [Actinobacteria bacterium HGW-Actinobacteria-7]|jgi:hypothetical protein|nr:MAG: hypothetical protein CVT67_09405 [Actinobacteria bacterium HGW-Actinobacteria-7]
MRSPSSLQGLLDSLTLEAVGRTGVPEDVAVYAARATRKALEGSRQMALSPERCTAYFWAVVRRRTVRGGGDSAASARFVLSAVVADLTQAGRDSKAVWREIERGWADRVPRDVLEEYRLRLCA